MRKRQLRHVPPRPLQPGAYTGRPTRMDSRLAKPNYSYEKRQRELAKKKKQDEKDARKRARRDGDESTPSASSHPNPGSADGT